MEIKIKDKTYKVRELLAIEADYINWADAKAAVKAQVMLSTGMSEEEYNTLTMRERIELIQVINKLNLPEDFQQPTGGANLKLT